MSNGDAYRPTRVRSVVLVLDEGMAGSVSAYAQEAWTAHQEATGHVGFADPEVWSLVEVRRQTVLEMQFAFASAPRLEVLTHEGDRWFLGEGVEEVTRVEADRYELWRSLEGRRTQGEVRDFQWSADPDPFLDSWPGFVFRWVEDVPNGHV